MSARPEKLENFVFRGLLLHSTFEDFEGTQLSLIEQRYSDTMARPIWTGSISFGMVAIPIRLVPAVRKKSISFNQLDERTMSRIKYKKYCIAEDVEVSVELD